MATERYRMRFDFQLNAAKDEEHAIAEQITLLKQQGLYSKTVRDGIRLVSDLREGNLEVLFELFPWVRAEFLEYVTSRSRRNPIRNWTSRSSFRASKNSWRTAQPPSSTTGQGGQKP